MASNRKRAAQASEPIDRAPKRGKPNNDAEEGVSNTNETKRTTTRSRTKKPEAGSRTANESDQAYTKEECYWIRFHYHQMNFAVTNRSVTAPQAPISCLYFNAYFQGHTSDPVFEQISYPIYPKRTFKSFNSKCKQLIGTTLDHITNASSHNRETAGAKEFRPIVTSPCLESYREILDKQTPTDTADIAELTSFLTDIVDQQLQPYKPTWITDGKINILSRDRMSLENYTAHHPGEVPYAAASALRRRWHENSSNRNAANEYLSIARDTARIRENFRIARRGVHADVGNALLNMAVVPPRGYDGDLGALVGDMEGVELPEMSEAQRAQWEEHIEAVRAGDELRKRVFDEAVWPVEASETDSAARVLAVREQETVAVEDEMDLEDAMDLDE